MDKNEFIQRAAIEIYANNLSQVTSSGAWRLAKELAEAGSKFFGSAQEETQSFPAYVPPAYPRNMHVNGVVEDNVPF